MCEVEIVLYDRVFANAIKKNKMDVLVWVPGEIHEYENKGSKVARVLCIAMPNIIHQIPMKSNRVVNYLPTTLRSLKLAPRP